MHLMNQKIKPIIFLGKRNTSIYFHTFLYISIYNHLMQYSMEADLTSCRLQWQECKVKAP